MHIPSPSVQGFQSAALRGTGNDATEPTDVDADLAGVVDSDVVVGSLDVSTVVDACDVATVVGAPDEPAGFVFFVDFEVFAAALVGLRRAA